VNKTKAEDNITSYFSEKERILRVGVKRMGPDSFQWCPVTGQGAMGTN